MHTVNLIFNSIFCRQSLYSTVYTEPGGPEDSQAYKCPRSKYPYCKLGQYMHTVNLILACIYILQAVTVQSLEVPRIVSPMDVLIEVKAASLGRSIFYS
jgi:hypothetical protein